jgi:hypothetical protein
MPLSQGNRNMRLYARIQVFVDDLKEIAQHSCRHHRIAVSEHAVLSLAGYLYAVIFPR